MLDLFLSFF